jgi:hypothetical protein
MTVEKTPQHHSSDLLMKPKSSSELTDFGLMI